jgi:hypothetical protein
VLSTSLTVLHALVECLEPFLCLEVCLKQGWGSLKALELSCRITRSITLQCHKTLA